MRTGTYTFLFIYCKYISHKINFYFYGKQKNLFLQALEAVKFYNLDGFKWGCQVKLAR